MPASPATQVRSFHLDAPLVRVFPLFTAQGERAWAPGWEPRILSGSEERGSAFITTAHNGGTVTWIVTDYRPAERTVIQHNRTSRRQAVDIETEDVRVLEC